MAFKSHGLILFLILVSALSVDAIGDDSTGKQDDSMGEKPSFYHEISK